MVTVYLVGRASGVHSWEHAPLPHAEAGLDLYAEILGMYLRTHGEDALYQASLMSRGFVEQRIGPEEIVALHVEALQQFTRDLPDREQAMAASDGLHFLLEVMIAYGVQHKEYLELRLKELARAEFDKSEVLAVIAHELRTPITTARGSLDLAERSLARGDVERISPLLGRSREAVDRLARLTRDLLDASGAQAARFQRAEVNLNAVLAQACTWAQFSAQEKQISLRHDTAGLAVYVLADADALLSVFGNLLTNAIRYTPEGGQVTLSHGLADRQAWAQVSDTGIGMAPEVRDRIFEKFFRAPEAHQITTQGLGLGLTLVKQIVDALGGAVEVESTVGHGSTFRIRLPALPTTRPTEEH